MEKKPIVLIATRNSVFDPWLGNLKSDLSANFEIIQIYCSERKQFNKFVRKQFKYKLKGLINFLGIANIEGWPYLYSRDWAPSLSKKLFKYPFLSRIFTSSSMRKLIMLLVFVYRQFPSKIELQLLNDLANLEKRPSVVIAMPTNMPSSYESEVVEWAKKNKIKSLIPIMTLDNITSKGIFLENPDYVVCWNEIQALNLENHHFIPRDSIKYSKSLFFENWMSFDFDKKLKDSSAENMFLYVCSSSRIGGYRHNKMMRKEESRTIIRLAQELDRVYKSKGHKAYLKIRIHPTFEIDHMLSTLKFTNLELIFVSGEFPNNNERDTNLIEDLKLAKICFGLNTSAFIQSSLLGTPSVCIETFTNRIVTTETAHLKQLITLGIVKIWNPEFQVLDLSVFNTDSQLIQQSQKFVGFNYQTFDQLLDRL